MFAVWEAPLSRPTMDIDLLETTPGSMDHLVSAIEKACLQTGTQRAGTTGHLQILHVGLSRRSEREDLIKNWLFSGNPRGAKASATLYSLIETAKANGLEPYSYLRFLFEKLPLANSASAYKTLLPQHVDRSQLLR